MRPSAAAVVLTLLVPFAALADEPLPPLPPPVPVQGELSPPPPPPSLDVPTADLPPPPPVPSPYYEPGKPQTGYPYSPAAPQPFEKPGPEIGLIVSESLFGLLTAAGITLLPYFLLVQGLVRGAVQVDTSVSLLLAGVLFATVPLAVSQTVVSIANGSRHYVSESWPVMLAGLGAEAVILFVFYLGIPKNNVEWAVAGGVERVHWSEWVAIFGTMLLVPAVEILVLNLVKQPRVAQGAALRYQPGKGLQAGVPTPVPLLGSVLGREQAGLYVPLVSGAF